MATVPAAQVRTDEVAIIAEMLGVRGIYMRYHAAWPAAPYIVDLVRKDGVTVRMKMSLPDWEFGPDNSARIMFVYRSEEHPYPLYVMLDNKV